jgi:hypothetical protein
MKVRYKILLLSMTISAILVIAHVWIISSTILAAMDDLESEKPETLTGGGLDFGLQKERQRWVNFLVSTSVIGFIILTLIFYFIISWIKEGKKRNLSM